MRPCRLLGPALALVWAAGCLPPSPPIDPQPAARRTELDFHDFPTVVTTRVRLTTGTDRERHHLECRPRLLLAGSRRVRVRVKLEDTSLLPGDYRFDPRDRIEILGHAGGRDVPVGRVRVRFGRMTVAVPEVPADATGYKKLVIDQTARGGRRLEFDYALRVVEKLRVAFTFDDGPDTDGDPADGKVAGSSTKKILDALAAHRHGPGRSRRGIKAAFFVLTGPEEFMGFNHPRGETRDGRVLLERMAREGHLVEVHWGGRYGKQSRHHTSRVDFDGDGKDDDGDGRADEDAPYDVTGDGKPDGANALESDLLECVNRIRATTGLQPEFVRPPEWAWRDRDHPETGPAVLATYRRLRLKPTLTDARLGDGGHSVIAVFVPEKWELRLTIQRAVEAGHSDIVVTMHDSNALTGRRIKGWLRRVERILGGIRLGGRRLRPARDVIFAADRETLRDILRGKRRFALDPSFRAAPR